jgi:LmbE family N-acetylglucosaminyl deacetylase
VWAHPDDEAFLSAGIMALAREAGQPVTVVTATLGEHGTNDPRRWPPRRLAEIRRRELDRSLAAVGVRDHVVLGYADGGCAGVDPARAVHQIERVIRSARPDTILTFGSDGYTGHVDHRTVSRWTTAAVEQSGTPARLLHAATDETFLDEFADVHAAFDVLFAGRPRTVDPEDMAVDVRLSGRWLDLKVAALEAHTSQVSGLIAGLGVERFRRWVRRESFAEPAVSRRRETLEPAETGA